MKTSRRKLALAWTVSGSLHASFLFGLVVLQMPLDASVSAISSDVSRARMVSERREKPLAAEEFVSDSSESGSVRTAIDEPAVDDSPAAVRSSSVPGSASASDLDPQSVEWQKLARQRLNQVLEEAKKRPAEEQLARLEKLAGQLSSTVSEKSVNNAADFIGQLIQSESDSAVNSTAIPTATPGDAAKPDAFDIETAQIVDAREEVRDGKTRLVAVMKDAKGLSSEVPLDEASGRQLVRTFELMKKFPLLDAIYRKSVMPLLDQVMRQERSRNRSEPEKSNSQRPIDGPTTTPREKAAAVNSP